jgi:hypothetical protein
MPKHIPDTVELVICEAGGGVILGTSSDEKTYSVCLACDIPRSLNKKHTCLFLVPFRVFTEKSIQSYYGCRWSMDIPPRNVPRNNDWCQKCLHWFPWSPDSPLPNIFSYSRKALKRFLTGMGLKIIIDNNETNY